MDECARVLKRGTGVLEVSPGDVVLDLKSANGPCLDRGNEQSPPGQDTDGPSRLVLLAHAVLVPPTLPLRHAPSGTALLRSLAQGGYERDLSS